jgi:hypothetical protein
MRNLSRAFAALTLSAIAAMPAAAGSNLIRNGSFETPAAPDGGGLFYSPGQSFKGWQVIGDPKGNVGVDSGDDVYCNHNFPARKGIQWLDLTGNTDNGAATGVQQSIETKPGSTYSLTLYVGNVIDTGGLCGTSSTVTVLIDGVAFENFTNKRGGGTDQNWKRFSAQFVAANATTTIAFINGDPSGDADNGLDAVSVELVNVR